MKISWSGCAAENFLEGRPAGMKPEVIVLHSIDGSLTDAYHRFNTPGTDLSSHYSVGCSGEIHQYVVESDTAFHAGYIINPSSRLVQARQNVNPNYYTIGIEIEGKPGDALTAAQSAAASSLIRDISGRWNIPLDRDHIIGHSEIRASVNCPGPALDVSALLNMPIPAAAVSPASVASVTLVTNANFRSRPSVSASVVRIAPKGTAVTVTSFVTGDAVNGNPFWYRDIDGNYLWVGTTDRVDPQAVDQVLDLDETTDTMDRQAPVIDRSSFRLREEQFYPNRYRKDLIVLHFTAGTDARSAFDYWAANPEHIATAYIVDRDGSIFELFDPARWAFHLGVKGTNGRHDKRSIGIEIVNVGPLRLSTQDASCLNWWWPNNRFGKKYCSIDDADKYVKATYRGEQYFASFPPEQVQAVRDLVSHLCDVFSIERKLPPLDKQFVCDPEYFNEFSGVATHANFRRDKWDIGPAFEWGTLGIEHASG